MSKSLLHKTVLEEFKAFLDGEGIAHRPGRGDWQILQVCKDGKHWNCVYERLDMPEHYTTDMHLDPLVVKFCRQRKGQREEGVNGHRLTLEQQRDKLLAAARNLRDVKGRHHSEQAYARLMEVLAEVEVSQ